MNQDLSKPLTQGGARWLLSEVAGLPHQPVLCARVRIQVVLPESEGTVQWFRVEGTPGLLEDATEFAREAEGWWCQRNVHKPDINKTLIQALFAIKKAFSLADLVGAGYLRHYGALPEELTVLLK